MVFDFLFPNYTCLVCKGELNTPQNIYLCDTCANELPINTEPVMLRVPNQKQYFYKAYAAFEYQPPIVDLILRLKYQADGLTAATFAPFMAAVLVHKKVSADLIMPVPLSAKREKSRGYNQSLLLAREISKVINIPVADKVLIRIKSTEAQKQMTVTQRAANSKNAFVVIDTSAIKDKKIILVDDVFTSGATTNECARTLRAAGAKQVIVLTIAAVV